MVGWAENSRKISEFARYRPDFYSIDVDLKIGGGGMGGGSSKVSMRQMICILSARDSMLPADQSPANAAFTTLRSELPLVRRLAR